MDKAIEHPPRTIMEVYQNLPQGTLAELIDNALHMSPSPTFKHQKVLQILLRSLSGDILDKDKGEVLVAPFDVYLDETSNAVQPDITVILKENLGILNPEGHVHGVPDLLVEVLSPGNKDHDLIRKKDLYERFGVKEYWIVDPEDKSTLGYLLENDRYRLIQKESGVFNSPLLNLKFDF